MDDSTQLGALISRTPQESGILHLSSEEEGGEILTGGTPCVPRGLSNGNWMAPTVITGLDYNSRCSTKEIFGPVVTIHRFKSEDQAIKIANNTRYGLAEVYGRVIWKRGEGREFDSYWNDLGEYLVTQRSEGPIRR